MTVGERIAHKRKELGLSQEALGERMGVSRQSIYKWESDAALPEIEKLVNLSRVFSVSIDWLLGQEDESEKEELTPEQLRMVEEIVGRYLDAQPKPAPAPADREDPDALPGGEAEPGRAKRRRWPWLLGAAAIITAVLVFINLFSRLDQLGQNYQELQSSISYIRSDVNSQIYSITSRVEEVLQSQNTLTAEQSAEVVSADYAANTITISARAVPRTFTEGMTVEFLLVSGDDTVTLSGTLEDDHAFTAQLTGPLTDNIAVSVVFLTDGVRETQLLNQFSDLYTLSFPDIAVYSTLMGSKNIVNPWASVWMPAATGSFGPTITWYGLPMPEVSELRVGLFRDQKLLAWYEPEQQEQSESNPQFRLDGEWTMEPGHFYTVAAIVTDEYGREWVVSDLPVVYDAEEDFTNYYNIDDYSLISDPAEWEY